MALALLVICLSQSLFSGQLEMTEVQLLPVSAHYQAQLTLDFQPSAEVLEALDASVPLVFEFSSRSKSGTKKQTVTMSYAPLFERFELRVGNRIGLFRLRAEMLDAFSSLRGLPLALDTYAIRLQLDIGALPAPLRIPAVLNSDWYLDTGWVSLQTADASLKSSPDSPRSTAPQTP